MKTATLLALTVLAGPSLGQTGGSKTPELPPLLIHNVNVVPMDAERVLEARSVLVRDGRIERIAAAGTLDAPPGAEVVEGAGAYLTPGLVDGHVHLGFPRVRPEFARLHLALYLSHGITTVRNMHGSPEHLQLRESVRSGDLAGPRIVLASPMFGGPFAASAERAREGVRYFAGEGYDLIKVVRLGPELFRAVMDEARKLEIPVAGHVPSFELSLKELVGSGMLSIEHLHEFLKTPHFGDVPDRALIPKAVETIRASGVAVGTLLGSEFDYVEAIELGDDYFDQPGPARARELFGEVAVAETLALLEQLSQTAAEPRITREKLEFLLEFLAALDEAGVELVAGTDSRTCPITPGLGLHTELALYLRAGLSPYRALRAATVHPARLFGALDQRGTVEEGKQADLVLVAGNPLEDLGHLQRPLGIVLRGEWLDREALDALVEEAHRHLQER